MISVVREIYRCEKHRTAAAASSSSSLLSTERENENENEREHRGSDSRDRDRDRDRRRVNPVDLYEEEVQYPALREAVIAQEQALLRVSGFHTSMDLPHKHLLNMARWVGRKGATMILAL